jgi:CO/xanthine dehydrogenase Mo-binding subunit
MLFVGLLRSPHAHARIKHIDTSVAKADPDVAAVAVGTDLPISFGVLAISPDENAMAVEKVRYVGEIVAAVAAETMEAARNGVKKIIVEYEPLREFLDPHESLETCSEDEQIHSHTKISKNIHKTAELRFNEPEKAMGNSSFQRKSHSNLQA